MIPDLQEMSKRYWDGVPQELRFMCLNEVVGSGNTSCASSALNYLAGRLDECDSFKSGTCAWDLIRWIDITFAACLFPLELHDDDWRANIDTIERILEKDEKLLNKVAPSDYRYGHRTIEDENFRFIPIMYWQKLGVYFCVMYMYMEDYECVRNCFCRIQGDTYRNLKYLLPLDNSWKYATEDDGVQYHTPDFYRWETINKLYGEDLPSKKAYQVYMEIYDNYRWDLVEFRSETGNDKVCNYLLEKANKRFKHLKLLALGYGFCDEDDEEDDCEGDPE